MSLYRRIDGKNFLVLWTPKWMDMKPVNGLVDSKLTGAAQKKPK
jgi:hypothetical protein